MQRAWAMKVKKTEDSQKELLPFFILKLF
jgi:hypothetical protein